MEQPNPGLHTQPLDFLATQVLTAFPWAAAIIGKQFQITCCNAEFERQVARIQPDLSTGLAGNRLFDLVPRLQQPLEPAIAGCLSSGQPHLVHHLPVSEDTAWTIHLSPLPGEAQPSAVMMVVQPGSVSDPVGKDESWLRLQAIFDHAMDAILLVGEDNVILEANPAATNLLGIELHQLMGEKIWSISPPQHREIYKNWWFSLLEKGRQEGIYTDYNLRGELRTIEYRAVTHIIPGIHLAFLRDITRIAQVEDRLHSTETLLRGILEHAPMPIYATTGDNRIGMVNPAWMRLMGVFYDGMHMRDLQGLVSEKTIENFIEDNRRIFETGEPVKYVEKLDFGEEQADFFTVRFPLRDREGNMEAVGGISIDITDRMRAERVVQESEKKFRSLVAESDDGIVLTDENGRVIEWNHAQERIVGISAEEAMGKYLWDLQYQVARSEDQTAENLGRVREEELRTLQTGRSPWLSGLWEVTVRRPDGREVHVQSNTFVVQTERGYMLGSISRDVTQMRLVQIEVDQRNRELSSLLGLSKQLSSQLKLDQVLETALSAIIATLPRAEMACLGVFEASMDEMVLRHCRKGEPRIEQVRVSARDNWLETILLSHGSVNLSGSLAGLEGLFEGLAGEHYHSLLGVPLRLDGKSVGVVFVAGTQRGETFGKSDERWLQSLAAQVAVVMTNARLFEQVTSGQERLQALSRQLVQIQEEERRKIARELHDEVGQILTGLKLLLRMSAQSSGTNLQENLAEAQNLTNDLLSRVHNMSLELRPAMLDDLGLLPALLWQFDRITSQTGIQVIFRHSGLDDVRFDAEIETAAYRVAQEALTNVARHAGVQQVNVWAWANARELGLQVEDQGRGFDLQAVQAETSGLGVNGMRERLLLLGGKLSIQSTPGTGTRLKATIPIKDKR